MIPAEADLERTRSGRALAQLVDGARASRAYANYRLALTHVLAMKDGDAGSDHGDPSAYWSEELRNVDYLFDASPLVVAGLRRHCYHVTGVWPYNYRSHKDKSRADHDGKLRLLAEAAGGLDLFVPESDLLGGFGFELDGALVNLDTLKYFEALIALERGAVLDGIRDPDERSIVVEIGPGWGGFAYQLKTLFPQLTLVLVDLPELFLFSATYLLTAFPDATAVFVDGEQAGAAGAVDWLGADFVFLPSTALHLLTPPKVDLAVNMVSFQEMTESQVRAYVAHLHSLDCPFLYSLNRERSLYNRELSSVSEIVAEHYWPHEIDVLDVSYTKLAGRKEKGAAAGRRDNDYRHVVGWKRIAV